MASSYSTVVWLSQYLDFKSSLRKCEENTFIKISFSLLDFFFKLGFLELESSRLLRLKEMEGGVGGGWFRKGLMGVRGLRSTPVTLLLYSLV